MTPLLLLAAALAPALQAAPWPKLPLLPAIVQFEPDGRDRFCGSAELLAALNRHGFSRVLTTAERSPYDYILTCAPAGKGKAALELLTEKRERVRGLAIRLAPDQLDKSAVVAARELATDQKVVEHVLKRRLAKVAWYHGLTADEAFKRKEWGSVVSEMDEAAESDIDDAPFYVSLYVAHARLGHAEKAKWYLACFLQAAGKDLDDLNADQLAPLKEMRPIKTDENERALALQRSVAAANAAKDWPESIRLTKELVRVAPWFVTAYKSLADSYAAVDWEPFSRHWKRREKLARAVGRDQRRHDDIEKAILP